MLATRPKRTNDQSRLSRLLAKVRGRQLETALRGLVEQSARYAQRAQRLRRFA